VHQFNTNLEFGKEYREKNTGFVGKVTGIYFYEFGCTRATLISMDTTGKIQESTFDEQALIELETQKPVESVARVGGPREAPPRDNA